MDSKWSALNYGETKTVNGRSISFECLVGEIGTVKTFFAQHVYDITTPIINCPSVAHGGYGHYTRYKIKQHKYAGGRCGFIEVIEILNPPEDRCPFVIYEYNPYNKYFSEWKSAREAIEAFNNVWGSDNWHDRAPENVRFQTSC